MTKPNFTSINVLLDRSGSMRHLAQETIDNFNLFLDEQKAIPGEAVLSLCLFDTNFDLVHDCASLQDVPHLTDDVYYVNGYTALLDALGSTIDTIGSRLSEMPEEERPSKVLFVVVTDGKENASKKFSIEKIKEMVQHQTDVYSWQFAFTGANIDSFETGQSMGFARQNSVNYAPSAAGTESLYRSISKSVSTYRLAPQGASFNFVDVPNLDPNPVVIQPDPTILQPDPAPRITPPVNVPVTFNPPINFGSK